MDSHKRVHTLHVLGTGRGIISVKVGMSRAVDSLFAVDNLAKVGGKLFVGRVSTSPEGIPSNSRNGIIVEVGHPCRLAFVYEIRMPAGRPSGAAEVGFGLCCL